MTIFTTITLFWVLPVLITAFGLIQASKWFYKEPPEIYNADNWFTTLFCSLIYPIGIFVIICTSVINLWPLLVKERGKRKQPINCEEEEK